MRLGFQSNEIPMAKRLVLSELPINTRKWRKFCYYQIKKIEPVEERKPEVQLDKKGNPITKPGAKPDPKQQVPVAEPLSETASIMEKKEPQYVEEKIFKILEFESEG